MSISAWIILLVIILGAFLAFKFIKSMIKVLLLIAVAVVVLFFVSKYTGFSIW
ncbi:hypothetical protein KY345_01415 [Candidatus Woesearchaeota archaeon]|nr:hypothetical protein [Candidatus Woesearchaeota archaeon]